MAGPRELGLRRFHVLAEILLDVKVDATTLPVDVVREFWLSLPDARIMASLSVFFVPVARAASWEPGHQGWGGVFANGTHGLCVQAMESAQPVSNRLFPIENVFGSPSAFVPLPGDVYGWLVSARPESREWRGQLKFSAPNGWITGGEGFWVVRATVTDDTGGMTEDEWQRVADRVALRVQRGSVMIGAGE